MDAREEKKQKEDVGIEGKLKEGYRSLTWLNRHGDVATLEKRLTLRLHSIQLLLYSFF